MYFPEGLFNAPPITQYCGMVGSGFTLSALGARKDSKDFFNYYFLGTQSGETSVNIEAYSVGR